MRIIDTCICHIISRICKQINFFNMQICKFLLLFSSTKYQQVFNCAAIIFHKSTLRSDLFASHQWISGQSEEIVNHHSICKLKRSLKQYTRRLYVLFRLPFFPQYRNWPVYIPSEATKVSVRRRNLYGSRNTTFARGAPRPGSWIMSCQ